MNFEQFVDSLRQSKPPAQLPLILEAMWYAGKDNWDKAHDIAQEIHDKQGSWVHAYLHRVEGDQWNADYWYRKAGRSSPSVKTSAEWENIVKELLTNVPL